MDSGLLAESIQDSAMLRVYSIATALGVLKPMRWQSAVLQALSICQAGSGSPAFRIPPSETDNPWLSLVWSQAIHDMTLPPVDAVGLIKDWRAKTSKDS